MPSDFTNPLDPPPLPRLCVDHKPVLGNLKHLDDVNHYDTANVRAEFARQCPQCSALNDDDRSLR